MGQEKRISDSELKDVNVHKLKDDYVGKGNSGFCDLFYEDEEIIIKSKDDNIFLPTGMSKEEAKEYYPKEKKGRRY